MWARCLHGWRQEFSYHADGMVKQISDSNGGKMTWAPDGRFTGAALASGMSIKPHYEVSRTGEPRLQSLTFHHAP